jgi:hypothetical protein
LSDLGGGQIRNPKFKIEKTKVERGEAIVRSLLRLRQIFGGDANQQKLVPWVLIGKTCESKKIKGKRQNANPSTF